MFNTSENVMSEAVINRLKQAGELRIEDFTKDRVDFLNTQINEVYREGEGISATNLSTILYGYSQPISKYEGIAFYALGLVATRDPQVKNGTLLFVRKEEAGHTLLPVINSPYHNLGTVSYLKNAIDSVWENDPTAQETKGHNFVIVNQLSEALTTLSSICNTLSSAVKTLA